MCIAVLFELHNKYLLDPLQYLCGLPWTCASPDYANPAALPAQGMVNGQPKGTSNGIGPM